MNRFLTNYNSAVFDTPTNNFTGESAVVGSAISGDNIPGATIKGVDINGASFLLGLFVGIILVLLIRGIISYAKFIIKDNKEMAEKLKQFETKR